MQERRHLLRAAVAGGKIYAIGGFPTENMENVQPTDTVEVYDPTTNSWSYAARLRTPRGFNAVAEVGGKIYEMGGFNPTDENLDSVGRFDPATKRGRAPHPWVPVGRILARWVWADFCMPSAARSKMVPTNKNICSAVRPREELLGRNARLNRATR